jgi:hypothetical protein
LLRASRGDGHDGEAGLERGEHMREAPLAKVDDDAFHDAALRTQKREAILCSAFPAIPLVRVKRTELAHKYRYISEEHCEEVHVIAVTGERFLSREYRMLQFKLIAAATALVIALGASATAQTSDSSASQPSAPTTSTPAPQPDQGATQSDPSGSASQQSGTDSTSQQPQQGQDSSTSQPH